MSKLLSVVKNGIVTDYMFDCPACGYSHVLHIFNSEVSYRDNWNFNGSLEKPTFTPSLLNTVYRSDGKIQVCHLYITDGTIQYLADCTHSMAGQTVKMMEWD